ncbi:hypothetical protein B0H16DRAFT_1599671, partial [Mycena metata]
MRPLRRWPTPQSIYSHWSDSTPIGPSFPIHAVAKPLSKYLYHRQAAGIIAKNGDSPLSADMMEVLGTYLTFVLSDYLEAMGPSLFRFKDIFPSTRVLVLGHLIVRAEGSPRDAQVVVDFNVPGSVPELLLAPNRDIQSATSTLFRVLAHDDKHTICSQLISVFNHGNLSVQRAAVDTLNDLHMVSALLHLL